jgi:membrane-bound lytic murein transglycosylase D
MRLLWIPWIAVGAIAAGAAAPAPTPTPQPGADDLYNLGQQLFDQYAPPEVKSQYEFPTRDQWDQFAARLQQALDNNSLGDLAAFEPEARAALVALRAIPGYGDYADWLELRIDEIEAAKQAVALAQTPTPSAGGAPGPS